MTCAAVNEWLKQSLKRERAEAKLVRQYRRTGCVRLPPLAEMRLYPCDVCMGYAGERGHVRVLIAVESQAAYLSVQCDHCFQSFPQFICT